MKYFFLCLFLIIIINIAKAERSTFLRNEIKLTEDPKDSLIEPKIYKGYCFMKIKNNFYDLNPFNSIKPYHLKSKNGQLIYFNFCSNVETSCLNNEAMVVSKERCKRFSDVVDQEKTWSLNESSKRKTVLTVNLPEGDDCEKKKDRVVKYTTAFEITCDRKVNDFIITNEKEFDPKKCHNVIKIKSKYGNHYIYSKDVQEEGFKLGGISSVYRNKVLLLCLL